MNTPERIQMVKAMEFIARQLNDEGIFLNDWLSDGVADSDIEYGDLTARPEEENDEFGMGYYIEDEHFSQLMHVFLRCMAKAKRNGGRCCDGIVDTWPKT